MPEAPLVLVGFMGCGKSTIGLRLAQRLGWYFCDLDEKIEAHFGLDVPAIFHRWGEPAFRRAEQTLLEQWLDWAAAGRKLVIASGGGTFAQPANFQRIQQSALSVFLELPLEALLARCAQIANRPLFRDAASFQALYHQRLPYYRQAHHVIACGDLAPDVIVDRILATAHAPAGAARLLP